ncbi:MAG: RNA polymerase factor sigma-54 [Gammaproteobacteria bacterium]
MKPTLGLQQTQRLSITPEMRQALGLLQMSVPELRDLVQDALERNLLLERADDDGNTEAHEESAGTGDAPVVTPAETVSDPAPEELPAADWDSVEPTWSSSSYDGQELPEPAAPAAFTLHEHLRNQLQLGRLSLRDRAIGLLLIDSINDDGYLTASFEELREAFGDPANPPEPAEMEAVLHHLQTLDPPGVAARNLAECLGIQLRQLQVTPTRELALQLAAGHLESLAAHAHAQLARLLAVTAEELDKAVALIQSLNPRPGRVLAADTLDFVVPDVLVTQRDHRWLVELNPETTPRLRVNRIYAAALGRRRSGAHADLGRQLQEARWLIHSLKMRGETLLRVAECIVRQQAEFLRRGEEAMRPLMLKDVAAELTLHESTISRVVANKYLATPRGTFAFRHFFSNELSTDSGEARSTTAVRAVIRKLVAEEDSAHPMSDDRITRELVSRGIQVARRTVTKYREALDIPATHERKRRKRR